MREGDSCPLICEPGPGASEGGHGVAACCWGGGMETSWDFNNPRNDNPTDDDQEQSRPSTRENINHYNDYKIGKTSPPPIIGSYTHNSNHGQLDYRLNVNCVIVIGASITSSEEPSYPPLGSWTVFNSKTSNVKTYKSENGFLPVIPKPRSDWV